jgi:hypothetical protein
VRALSCQLSFAARYASCFRRHSPLSRFDAARIIAAAAAAAGYIAIFHAIDDIAAIDQPYHIDTTAREYAARYAITTPVISFIYADTLRHYEYYLAITPRLSHYAAIIFIERHRRHYFHYAAINIGYYYITL